MKNRKDIIALIFLMAVSSGALAAPLTGTVHFSGRITAPACDTNGITSQVATTGSALCWHKGKLVKTNIVRGANGQLTSKPPQIGSIQTVKINDKLAYHVFNYN